MSSIMNMMRIIKDIFNRVSLLLFIIIVTGGLIVSVITLNDILTSQQANDNVVSKNNNNKVVADQTTINGLNKLKKSSDNTTAKTLPSGRINPFAE